MATIKKYQSGGKSALGMKSVKAGFDKNPGVTRADIIVAAKKQAKGGVKLKKKAKAGSSLKPVDKSKNPGLAKLPTEVRNKMGYQKMGGKTKKAKGGAALKKQAAVAIAMKKAGKSPKKAMGGYKMMKMGGKCRGGCY